MGMESKGRRIASRFMMTAALLTAVLLGGRANCFATNVSFQWSANPETNIAGYKVYYQAGSPAQPFAGTGATEGASPVNVGNKTTATLSNLDPARTYYFAITAYNTSGQESSYSSTVTLPERLAPSVSLTAPASGATATGTVSITASATDNVGVSKVEFYVNGALQGSDTSTPYLYSWNTAGLAAGTYTLMAKAYDAAGNVGQSAPVSVTVVNDTTAPTVAISSPASGATVSGTVPVAVSAADSVGVSKVEFYDNGVLLSATNVSPYGYNWNTLSVADGTHTLTARAYDAAGNVGQSTAVTLTVKNTVADTTAPTVAISAPAIGATLSGTTTVTATAADNTGVSRVEFYLDSALKSTDTASPYSYSWDTATVANGTHTLTAKAYDAAGNVGQSATVTVTVSNTVADTTAPTAAMSAPAAGATVSGATTVTATAADNTGVTKVEFYLDSALKSTDTASPYSYSWDTATVANGTHTLTAKAYDAAGNVGQSTAVTVTVSNTVAVPGTYTAVFGNGSGSTYPNTIEDTFLNINNDVNAAGGTLNTYSWPAYKPANAVITKWNISALPAGAQIQSATLSLYLIGSGGDALYEIPASAVINKLPVLSKCNGYTYDGVNAWSPSSVAYNSVPLAQGDIALPVNVQQVDKTVGYKSWDVTGIVRDWMANPSGNRGLVLNSSAKATSDSYRTFASSEATDAAQRPKLVVTYTMASTADTTAPTVAVSAPAGGATVSGTTTVTATASDNTGVARVEFYLDGALKSTDTASPYSYGWDTATVANGTHTLTAKAYDAAGNVGQSAAVTVTVSNTVADTTVPTVAISAPAAGATVSGTTTVTATASDNTGVSKVEFYLDGALKSTDTASPYSYSWDTAAVANGTHTLTAKAYDAAGNVGQSASVTVTVSNTVADITAPTVAVSAPAAGATVSGTTTVTATAADNTGVSRVEFYVDGALKSTDTASPYSYGWDTATVANGAHTLTAKAYDAAGNVGQSGSVTVTVSNVTTPPADTTAPTVSISTPAAGAKVGRTVTISASATDNTAVTRMELYVDNILKATVSSGSLTSSVSVNKGSHVIKVNAYDAAGNMGTKSQTFYR